MKVHFLGTGAAVSDIDRVTTMLAVESGGHHILIDCGSNVFPRMVRAGLDPTTLSAIVLTHEHPDHVSSFPLLIEQLWLMGRREPIPVYAPESAVRVVKAMYHAFDYTGWDGLPDIHWNVINEAPLTPFLEVGPFRLLASPVDHPVPTVGLRIEAEGRAVSYSADTSKCQNVIELARGADLLVHEATGSIPGVHASPEEAAEVAAAAGVERLALVHVPMGVSDDDLEAARQLVPNTRWALDGDCHAM